MVRRNELACRDEWSRSLWQPRDVPHANGDQPFERPIPSPLAPALAESLRSVLDHDTALAASAQGEDVLLSEGRIVSEAHESWELDPRPFPVGNFDPRTAIFRAREAYRERARAKATADRQSAGAEAMTGSVKSDDFTSSAPEVPEAEPGGHLPPDALVASGDREIPVTSPEAGAWSTGSSRDETSEAKPVLAIDSEAAGARDSEKPTLFETQSNVEETLLDSRSFPVPGRRSEFETPEIQAAEGANLPTLQTAVAESETLPDWYRSDLPRICRTCRDYRPSADGQRGWCANSWAFTHRRLVLEDDPAPCQSAIGDWWLPVDDIWLVAADVSSHGRATPLLDRLTVKVEQQRRRS